MNLHLPQSLQSENELLQLAYVPTQIISPKDSKPITSAEQDVLLGIHRITKSHVKISQKQFNNLICNTSKFAGNEYHGFSIDNMDEETIKNEAGEPMYTGHDLLSYIIPKNISITLANNSFGINEDDPDNKKKNLVIVENGIIKQGTFDKGVFGKKTHGLVHTVSSQNGSDDVRDLFNDTQKLICRWLIYSGFSVGVSDIMRDMETESNVKEAIREAKIKATVLINSVHLGTYENKTVRSNKHESFEADMANILGNLKGKLDSLGMKYVRNATGNRIVDMVDGGSKGGPANIRQIVSALAQQDISGARAADGFDDRTLPYFTKYDDTPESRGFVHNSLVEGLAPHEFFFHAMAGREGLIDTAVKTSETGYIQRKLVKAMEDCKIEFDLTVRDANNNIVQFLYGEDGINATSLESQTLFYMSMESQQMENEFLFSYKDDGIMKRLLTKETYDEFEKVEDGYERCMEHYSQLIEDKKLMIQKIFTSSYDKTVDYPVSLARAINSTKAMYKSDKMKLSTDLSPLYVLDRLDEMDKEIFLNKNNRGNKLFMILLRCYFSPKQMIKKYNFSKAAFDYMTSGVKDAFYKTIAEPSEMVGVVSAQSIGEPCTQLVLNSVDWSEDVLYMDKNNITHVRPMGEIVDDLMKARDNKVQKVNPKTETEYLEMKDLGWRIQTVDENGKMHWKDIEAVTRHLPGYDGKILEVKTKSGRVVKATKSKSFLLRKNNRIVPVNGSELQIGDRLPITVQMPKTDYVDKINLESILSKKEYVYSSEIYKAINVYHQTKGIKWHAERGKGFEVPFNRPDSMHESMKKWQYDDNHKIYSKMDIGKNGKKRSFMMEDFVLDRVSGFFIGAYCAEGTILTEKFKDGREIDNQLIIANNDEDYINEIKKFAERYDIGYHEQKFTGTKTNKKGVSITGTSNDIRLHSRMLCKMMRTWCGKYSHLKNLPEWIYSANDEFAKGLLDAYISGDGCIDKEYYYVTVSSTSRQMLYGLENLLIRFNIFTTISSYQTKSNNAKSEVIYRTNAMSIRNQNVINLANNLKLTVKDKQTKLSKALTTEYRYSYGKFNIIPGINLNGIDREYHRDELINKLEYYSPDSQEYKLIFEAINSDVYFDPIVSIEEIEPSNPNNHKNPLVYDFTVADTRNFTIFNKLSLRDTFHSTGSTSRTVKGVPRIKELLSFSKNLKTPAMTVYINDEFSSDLPKCQEIRNKMEITHMQDIVKVAKILNCPRSKVNQLADGDNFFNIYDIFEKNQDKHDFSPWMIIYEFDKDKIYEFELTMIDISNTLRHHQLDSKYTLLYHFADDNAHKLAMRVNVQFTDAKGASKANNVDVVTELKTLNQYILDLPIKGIKGIQKAIIDKQDIMKYNTDTNTFEKSFEWVITTDGINLSEVLAIPQVDIARTTCNDIHAVREVLGIDAAKRVFIREFMETLQDVSVGYRHISLLADIVTSRGYLLSVDRHGINKSEIGPLAKASFEETSLMLTNAGIHAEHDNVRGVSANMMLGQIPPAGTGDTKVLIDFEKLATLKSTSDLHDIDEDMDEEGDCTMETIGFDFKISTVNEDMKMKDINITDNKVSNKNNNKEDDVDIPGESIPGESDNHRSSKLRKEITNEVNNSSSEFAD